MPDRPSKRRKAILLVDRDLGLILKLSGAANELGWRVLPSFNLKETARLLARIKAKFDVLIVEEELWRAWAPDAIHTLVHLAQPEKIVLTTRSAKPVAVEGTEVEIVTLRRPAGSASKKCWNETLRKVLAGAS